MEVINDAAKNVAQARNVLQEYIYNNPITNKPILDGIVKLLDETIEILTN